MEKEKETFKFIADTDKRYSVSNLGKVRNNHNGMPLRGTITPKGYRSVSIFVNGESKTVRVHRLVAEAFIPNPENKATVNHIDGNKLNNVASNLEWMSNHENLLHAKEMGLLGGSDLKRHRKISKEQAQAIKYIIANHPQIKQKHLAEAIGVSRYVISDVLRGQSFPHLTK